MHLNSYLGVLSKTAATIGQEALSAEQQTVGNGNVQKWAVSKASVNNAKIMD